MPREDYISATERLVALMDHLGLGTAHFGTPIPRDISGMATEHPERLAGIVLCVPSRLDPAPFADIAARVLMISGESGPAAEATARAVSRLPAAEHSVLAGYDAPGSWSDAVAERTHEIVERIIAFLAGRQADMPRTAAPTEGTCAGISYRVEGAGPASIAKGRGRTAAGSAPAPNLRPDRKCRRVSPASRRRLWVYRHGGRRGIE